jgi:hypothetical protein
MRRRRSKRERSLDIVWTVCCSGRSLALCRVVSRVVIVKRAARVVALQRAPVRCVVTRGRQRESGVEWQLEYSLHQAFAKTRLADNQATAMILNRARNDFRRRGAVAIDENH